MIAHQIESKLASRRDDEADQLRQENRQLRELVVQLSRLVIRNVVEQSERAAA